jgi:penicillin-binding protein-related factor A (putative recombinase)
MAVKQAEADFAKLCARYNIWCHKWTDVRYCPNCHKPIFVTKRTDQQDNDPETQQSIVDYLIFTGSQPHWVECKGKGGDTRLALSDINPKQRNFLSSWDDKGVPVWLFVTLGDGAAPRKRSAWLIPWSMFIFIEETWCSDMKSIPWQVTGRKTDIISMEDSFEYYELAWDNGGWIFPNSHIMIANFRVDKLPSLYGDT